MLEKTLFAFLDRHYNPQNPVLLALSGGADSLALFYLLQSYRNLKPFHLAVAHVDHGWREESTEESLELEKLAKNFNITFHSIKLNPKELLGNLEQACREKRLEFFSDLCQKYHYQAVILGHHADDQSETVLKKVLEGCSLPYLQGMAACSTYQALSLWRPLLTCSKLAIKEWLNERGYRPFEDRTNEDKKFLRARFRTQIIPDLSRDFGKEISASLCRINKEARELRAYLNAQLSSSIQSICKGPFGSFIDLSTNCSSFDIEMSYLIRKLCENEGIQLSHHLIEEVMQKVRSKASNCQFLNKSGCVYVDRSRVFALKKPLASFNENIPLELGSYSVGPWAIDVTSGCENSSPISGWKEAWMGTLFVQLPQDSYFLKKGSSQLFKWWTNAKIPAFMRWAFPVVWSENEIVHEFLTKRRLKTEDRRQETGDRTQRKCIEIKLRYQSSVS